MNLKRTYQFLIWSGLIVFIAGIIGDGRAISALSYGAYLGPFLYGVGVIIWVVIRIKKPILHPFSSYENEPTVNTIFLFFMDNFMREFWGFCVAIMMIMLVAGSEMIKQARGYEAAIEELKINPELKSIIGEFNRIGPILGGSTSSQMINLGFSVYGTKGASPIRIKMTKESDKWEFVSLEIE